MKEIKAIIQPFSLSRVLDALQGVEGLPGITLSDTRAVSAEGGQYEQVVKTKLEIMVPDALADTVVQVIQTVAHTGRPGDGRIFVIPVEETVSISTGERSRAI